MGRISDRFKETLDKMRESDERMQRLINEFVAESNQHLDELKRLSE
tara:strand:- start:112 stop:249 length:138 start_codon:yes stop_codon:yes gene_type:complete